MPRWVSLRPSLRNIRKIGMATAIGGIIRVDRMKNSRSSFSGTLKRRERVGRRLCPERSQRRSSRSR